MPSLRTALHQDASDTIEYGEAILIALNLKLNRQLELAGAAENAEAVAILRLLVHIQAVQEKLSRERYRLSLFGR
jgi:hypothetical protein